MVIDQGDLIGSLEPFGHLTIGDDVDVPMRRKEFFKGSQAESQLVVVSVPPLNIGKLGHTHIAFSL